MNQAVTSTATVCPSCGNSGKGVSRTTMNALLNDDQLDAIQDAEYRFCDSAGCDVAYFTAGGSSFTKDQLRVEVGVKETAGKRPLCYCFGHSVESIKRELQTVGESHALDDIRGKMKDPGCRCETENPSGKCCLGSVASGIETAKVELELGIESENAGGRSSLRGERVAKIGTIVAAVMASSCCWLPLLLLALGVSGAGIVAQLEQFRPAFLTLTFGFLAAAFYFTYRPRRSEESCCAPAANEAAGCCDVPESSRRRFSMMTMNKVMLWVVTAAAVAFAFFPHYVGTILQGPPSGDVEGDTVKSVIAIKGMTCEGCSAIAAKAIGDVPGVVAVDVDYETGRAIILTEQGSPAPRDEILSALEGSGYFGTFDDEDDVTPRPTGITESRETEKNSSSTNPNTTSLAAANAATCTLSVSGMT